MSDTAELVKDPETDEFRLSDSPCHLIHRVHQFAGDCFNAALKDTDLTQRQFAVLTALAEQDGVSQTALVIATGIDRSTLAELVNRMSRKGLLQRARAANDGRANTVRLTPAGREMLNSARPNVESADKAFLHALPKGKRAAFVEALRRIADALDGVEDDKPAKIKKPKSAKPGKKPKPAKAAKGDKRKKKSKSD